MRSSSQPAPAPRRLRGGWAACALAVLLLAAPAWSAQVTEVRVGRHPGFTRVVFELDVPAGYRVERRTGASGPELQVTLDASARSQSIPFRTRGISKVVVERGGPASVAHITLREQGIPVKEMILSNPPRIVLDVMRENTPPAVAKKPAPEAPEKLAAAEKAAAEKAEAERIAAEKKAAAEKAEAERVAAEKKAEAERIAAEKKVAAEKLAAEKAAAEKAEAERIAAEKKAAAEKAEAERIAAEKKAAAEKAEAERIAAEKKAEAERLAAEKKAAAEKLAAEKAAAAKAEAERIAAEKQAAAEKLAAEKQAAAEKLAAEKKAEAEKLAAEKKAAAQAEAERIAARAAAQEEAERAADAEKLAALEQADAEETAPAGAETPAPEAADALARAAAGQAPAAKPATKPAKQAAKATPAKPPAAETKSFASGWLSNPIVLGAGAGVLLCLVGFVLLMRRRRPLPNDLDVTAIADSGDDDSAASRETLLGASGARPVASAEDEEASFAGLFDDEPETDSAAARDARPTEPAPRGAPPKSAPDDSLFDTDADPNAATKMGEPSMNQGTSDLPADPDRMGAAPAGRSSGAPDGDVLSVVHELERRMAQLEAKLQESNEARERLERQVAAQSEELRVQRAAIARTQRALRTMSRGDEDKATEPALREGDTQTKTRVSVE